MSRGSKITEIRDDETLGALSARQRNTPSIDPSASLLLKLIDCQGRLICVYLVKSAEVKKFINEPMQVPQWLCHTQAKERCVKQVTEAAGKVCTLKTCEDQEASRRLMSRNKSN